MSIASDYAAAMAIAGTQTAAVVATKPAPWIGAQGLRIDIADDGHAIVSFSGNVYHVPAAGMLVLRDWITTTFG